MVLLYNLSISLESRALTLKTAKHILKCVTCSFSVTNPRQSRSRTIFSNFVHDMLRMVPLCFSQFGRWRCRLDFGSVFFCMSSNSFAVVRRLVLFRVRQNQVTKNLFSNSSAGLATISARFRNIFFNGVFSFRFRLIVLRVLRFSAFSFFQSID